MAFNATPFCTFPFMSLSDVLRFLFQNSYFGCKNFVICLFAAVCASVSGSSQATGDIKRHAFADAVDILHVFAFPCDYVVPCGFGNSTSVTCLVKNISCKREVCNSAPVVLVSTDASDTSLELDPVDVIHKISLSF